MALVACLLGGQRFFQPCKIEGAGGGIVAGDLLDFLQVGGQLQNLLLLAFGLGTQVGQLSLNHAVFHGQRGAGAHYGFQHRGQLAQILRLLNLLRAGLQGAGVGFAELAQTAHLHRVLAQQLFELLMDL